MEYKIEEIKAMNIFEKMLHIQSEIPTVAKNLNVQTGKSSSYKAVSERDVKDAIKPLEEKYRVYSYPINKELLEQSFLERETVNGTRKEFYIRERVTYRFINIDNPAEFIEIDGYGDGIDSGDKACGKSDTYAIKYCILSAYKISTGDDPDQNPSEEYKEKKNSKITDAQLSVVNRLIMDDTERQAKMLKYYGVERLEDLDVRQASEAIKTLQKGAK